MVSKKDILATITYYSVLAALIVTVTYTSIITPPQAFSSCTDLCQPSLARLVLGVWVAFRACMHRGRLNAVHRSVSPGEPSV